MDRPGNLSANQRVGSTVRSARIRVGLSQQELATMLDVPQSWVSNAENGQRRLDLGECEGVAKALGMSLSEFVREFQRGPNAI